MNKYKCKVCGKEENPNEYSHSNFDEFDTIMSKYMLKKHMCFNCAFWHTHLDMDRLHPERNPFVVDGVHYVGSYSTDKSAFKGCGGRLMHVQYNNSDVIHDWNNVWCQGQIPEHMKDDFSQYAATFIEDH